MTVWIWALIGAVLMTSLGGQSHSGIRPASEPMRFVAFSSPQLDHLATQFLAEIANDHPDWQAAEPRIVQLERSNGEVALYLGRVETELKPGQVVALNSSWEYAVQTASTEGGEQRDGIELRVVDLIEPTS